MIVYRTDLDELFLTSFLLVWFGNEMLVVDPAVDNSSRKLFRENVGSTKLESSLQLD